MANKQDISCGYSVYLIRSSALQHIRNPMQYSKSPTMTEHHCSEYTIITCCIKDDSMAPITQQINGLPH
jgi:hypothetical protein